MSSLDNYEIIPATVTHIRHRSECIPYYDAFYSNEQGGWCLAGAHLPIFVAPMASVINEYNYLKFDENGLNPIIPRTVPLHRRLEILTQSIWVAMGLDEFKAFCASQDKLEQEIYICVDVANGHMQELIDVCADAKTKFGSNLILMTGNIANHQTYFEYAKAGIDYIRCGIGGGSVCSTAYLSGIHCSADQLLAMLVLDKYEVTKNLGDYKSVPKIVMDGGINSIRQIIIALAMGADYVMCGQLFAQCEEACGEIIWYKEWNPRMMQASEEKKPYRVYYGMSTERAQKEMGNKKLKHSEGVEKFVPIKYHLNEWVEEFTSTICSTMAYCDRTLLTDFVGNVKFERASVGEYESYEKSKFL